MDERTLTALKGSVAKWEAIVAGTGSDERASNCPLCAEFYDAHSVGDDGEEGDGCHGCPVSAKTGATDCNASPWEQWALVQYDLGRMEVGTRKADTPELVKLAQAELDFLRSLLPAEGAGQMSSPFEAAMHELNRMQISMRREDLARVLTAYDAARRAALSADAVEAATHAIWQIRSTTAPHDLNSSELARAAIAAYLGADIGSDLTVETVAEAGRQHGMRRSWP
jgi:hypothetical protein